jgi:hypothetical protein
MLPGSRNLANARYSFPIARVYGGNGISMRNNYLDESEPPFDSGRPGLALQTPFHPDAPALAWLPK